MTTVKTNNNIWNMSIITFISMFLCYIECIAISIIIYGLRVTKYKPKYDKDYIIILGCQLAEDGSLFPLLKGRVDKAIEFYKKQKELTGKELIFIPSGGQGDNEIIAEALSMKKYLLSNGIPESQIILEDKSKNTYENMLFSKRIIGERNKDAKVIFSTSNYHIFRSGIIANKVGLKAEGIGRKTKWYFGTNAFSRELLAIFSAHKKTHLVVGTVIFTFTLIVSIFESLLI